MTTHFGDLLDLTLSNEWFSGVVDSTKKGHFQLPLLLTLVMSAIKWFNTARITEKTFWN